MRGFYQRCMSPPGSLHVGHTTGATLGSSLSGRPRSCGQFKGPSAPNPPTPRPQSWGPGGFKPSRRVLPLPLFSLYQPPCLGAGQAYRRPAAAAAIMDSCQSAAQPRGMPVSRVRSALRKKIHHGQAYGVNFFAPALDTGTGGGARRKTGGYQDEKAAGQGGRWQV